jgi:hypothetical protein
MKCEICKKRQAEKAITRELNDGTEEELYVCASCAHSHQVAEDIQAQAMKFPGGAAITISGEIDNAPPFIGAIINAVNNVIGNLESAESQKAAEEGELKLKSSSHKLSIENFVASCFQVDKALHLEGLFLTGDLDAAIKDLQSSNIYLHSRDYDSIKEPGHIYEFAYSCNFEEALNVLSNLVAQEKTARERLMDDMKVFFADSVARALALLKSCRILSPAEYIDMLSPVRLAVMKDIVHGITLDEVDAMICSLREECLQNDISPERKDLMDIQRASSVRQRFADVDFTVDAKENFL